METKTKSKRKKHPEQFKREAVRLLESRGERTVADVAAGLGVAENMLHAWKKKYGGAAEQVRRERGGARACPPAEARAALASKFTGRCARGVRVALGPPQGAPQRHSRTA